MLHYLDFIKYIIKILKKLNNNDLIKYILVSLLFFYFVQGIDIGQLLSFGFIFILVVSFLQGDLKISEDQISEETQKKIDQIEKKIEQPFINITSGNNNLVKHKVPNINKMPTQFINIIKYITNLSEKTKDPTYRDIINKLLMFSKKFVKQINYLFYTTQNSKDYPQHTYQNIRELEKEISILLQSLYFKVENNQDMEIAQLIHNIENEMEKVNHQLENYINLDFVNNTNNLKGPIFKSEYPKAFDEIHDVTNRFLP
tara:strand:- start:1824 stop:2594 length:771 start_codon:yes stop_codon:yes gene_type:complete